MANAVWLADKLIERGLDVIEYVGWETRARPGTPILNPRGVVCHHTGPWSTIDGMVKLCINGRADLPGPLCQVVLDPDGVCHVIASGRSNHAGAGGWKGLSGNASVLGIEAIHSGSRAAPWPPAQVEAFIRCAAALAEGCGAEPIMVCAHREWTPSKIDPVTLDMADFRAGVAELLDQWHRPQGVRPMYSPPLDLEPIVADLACPTGGAWLLAASGAIYGFGGAPYKGAAIGQDYFKGRKAARLEPNNQGYTIVAESGERYDYP